ncbi:hypothetical protein RND71_035770 [Anisodus tanguticus]|uniref:GH10 domain-containing protein n=1 Tax=Anisodus tanguticus TaxID=243964 RepID=A0AAE1V1U5_9SOLA|nr:hypothetical protein RND71_035770 [Anisodus tanguticus]
MFKGGLVVNVSGPAQLYFEKIKETEQHHKPIIKIILLRAGRYEGPLEIGLQGHFIIPSQPYIRSALDTLASAKLPIWITELDVQSSPNQAQFLDQIIKEVVAHPTVQGLLIWSAWKPTKCYQMCLTDNNFKNLPMGDVVDKARATLSHEDLVGTTNAKVPAYGVEVDGVLEELGTLRSVSVLLLVVVSTGKVDSSLDLLADWLSPNWFSKTLLTFASGMSIMTVLRQGLRNQMLHQHRLGFHYRMGSSPVMVCLNQAGSRPVCSPPRLMRLQPSPRFGGHCIEARRSA